MGWQEACVNGYNRLQTEWAVEIGGIHAPSFIEKAKYAFWDKRKCVYLQVLINKEKQRLIEINETKIAFRLFRLYL